MTEREVMEYDVVIVGAGPGRPRVRDPPEAAQAGDQHLRAREGFVRRRALALRRGARARSAREAAAELAQRIHRHEGAGGRGRRAADDARPARSSCRAGRSISRRCTITATSSSRSGSSRRGWRSRPRSSASTSSRASPPPKRCSTSTARSRACASATWASNKDGTPGPELHAGRRDPRRHDDARRRRARLAHEAADREVQPARGHRSADVRPRLQGAVAAAAGSRAARPHRARVRLAARHRHLRRQLPVSPRPGSRVRRLRRRPELSRIRGSSRSRPSSSSSIIRASSRCSKAARSSRPARARSSPAATSRCRSWRCRARC